MYLNFRCQSEKKCLKTLRNSQEKGYAIMESSFMVKEITIFVRMAQIRLLKQFEKKYLGKTILSGQFPNSFSILSLMDSFMQWTVLLNLW